MKGLPYFIIEDSMNSKLRRWKLYSLFL